MELGADAALVLDPRRPGNHQPVACTAEVGGDLLSPLEGCAHRVRPSDGIMVVGHRPAECAGCAETHIVGQNRQDVGYAFRGGLRNSRLSFLSRGRRLYHFERKFHNPLHESQELRSDRRR